MDVGPCTDILEGCPKAKGMVMLLRSMSPDIVVADELGTQEDVTAVYEVLHCGVGMMATAHGYSFSDLERRLKPLMQDRVFERYILLSGRRGVGTLEAVLDRNGEIIGKGAD